MSPRWTREDTLAAGVSSLMGAFLMGVTPEPTLWRGVLIWAGMVGLFWLCQASLWNKRNRKDGGQ